MKHSKQTYAKKIVPRKGNESVVKTFPRRRKIY